MASGFFDRLLPRLDKLNSESLQAQMRRLAKERGFLETIFRTIQEGVLVLARNGALAYANPAAERLVGFSAAQQQGHSMARLLREWDWEHLLETPDGRDDGDWSRVSTREIELDYPEHRILSVYATPFDAAEGGVLLMLRDVTSERALADTARESERTDAVKLLAAGVAHEIGNPLNALNIHLQILERDLRDEAGLDAETRTHYRELVDVARSEVGRLDTIIRQFLAALRPVRPNLRPENPAAPLRDALGLLGNELANRSITVECRVPAEVPKVPLDPDQLKQVYYNLIRNAADAMADGGRVCVVFEPDDAFVNVSILDEGKGIPATELARIFEPYHTTKAKGNGLGLMIVKRIVEAHGGEIEVASKEGTGTCFRIRLPRVERRIRRLSARPALPARGAL